MLLSRLNGRGLTSGSRTSLPATKPSLPLRHARGTCMVIGLPISRPVVSAKAAPEIEQDSRTFRRTVADPAFWKKHRNVSRFSRHMFTMPGSRIIQGLAAPLAWLLTVSTALCIYETYLEAGQLPEYMPTLLMGNAQPQMLTSFAVSLLLVFRTNQSYDRWWEARKIWGGILNRVRDVTTQCVVFFPEEEHELRQACGRWTIAFARSLHAHLQEGVDVRNTLRNVLSPVELDMLCGSQHRVVKSLSVLAEIVKQAPMNPIQMQMMQLNVQFFYDALGMCERIYRTPLPLTYTRHTSRFLTLWLTTLPFTEWTTFGWATIPITLMIGMLLLGIDEIGVQIEEPFGVLPLDAICSRAELDARQIMNEQVLAKDYVQDMRDASSQYDKEEWERASKNVAALLAARN